MSSTMPVSSFKKLTWRHFLVVGLTVIALTGVAAASTGWVDQSWWGGTVGTTVAGNAAPLPVNVMELEMQSTIEQSRQYTGTIRARRRSELGFELAGRIADIQVDEGDRVRAGDTLAVLDTDTLTAQRRAMEAQLASAEALLQELTAGPRIEKIKQARADLQASESELENARQRLQRRQELFRNRAIPQEEYDQARFDVRSNQAAYDAAQERLAELEAGTRAEKLTAQQATVRQLEASVQEIEVALEKSKLTAPYDATVVRRYLDPGSIVQPSASVIKLVENSRLEAWVGLPVDVVAQLNGDQVYRLQVDRQTVEAQMSAKIDELDPATRTQTVLFDIDSASSSGAVVPGQLCKLEVATQIPTNGFWIPNDALVRGVRGLWSVMAVEPDDNGQLKAVKRDIEIIRTESRRVFARGTISQGDRIVANGVHRITEGQLVSVAGERSAEAAIGR